MLSFFLVQFCPRSLSLHCRNMPHIWDISSRFLSAPRERCERQKHFGIKSGLEHLQCYDFGQKRPKLEQISNYNKKVSCRKEIARQHGVRNFCQVRGRGQPCVKLTFHPVSLKCVCCISYCVGYVEGPILWELGSRIFLIQVVSALLKLIQVHTHTCHRVTFGRSR